MTIHTAKLVHMTPEADEAIAKLARVSNPSNEDNRDTYPKLIRYLVDHNHWSPFETVHATVEVNTTRDIGRQLLRHRSFSFQEFSGRYAAYGELLTTRECRFQDPKNRQASLQATTDDEETVRWWNEMVGIHAATAMAFYEQALERGVAKEQARAILPEGLVPTRMYVAGSIRSFIHYCRERLQPGVQKEHQLLAGEIFSAVFMELPLTYSALEGYLEGPTFAQVASARG
jgi:thymidylate synthase (FAD)